MRVLIGCEESGTVREAFKKMGHNVWSCDLIDTSLPGQHLIQSVLEVIYQGWDLAILHPPLHTPCRKWSKAFSRKNKTRKTAGRIRFYKDFNDSSN